MDPENLCMCGFKKVWKVNMDEMLKLLKEHDMEWNLQGERAEALWLQAKQYIVVNTALGVHFQKEGRKLFQYGTFKGHWMLHSVKLAHYLNPRRTMCYSGKVSCLFVKLSCMLASKATLCFRVYKPFSKDTSLLFHWNSKEIRGNLLSKSSHFHDGWVALHCFNAFHFPFFNFQTSVLKFSVFSFWYFTSHFPTFQVLFHFQFAFPLHLPMIHACSFRAHACFQVPFGFTGTLKISNHRHGIL